MAPLIAALLKSGLGLVANAVLTKGKEYIEEKAGVKLTENITEPEYIKLKQFELENERELRQLQTEDNRIEAEIEKAGLASQDSARAAYEAEWKYADHQSWFGKLVDGINRLVRPVVTIGLISMLFGVLPVPVNLPSEYWTVLLLVLGFWFGGRLLKKDGGVEAIKAIRK